MMSDVNIVSNSPIIY